MPNSLLSLSSAPLSEVAVDLAHDLDLTVSLVRDPAPATDDLVITVPKGMWAGWLAEGDLAGEVPGSGMYDEYHYVVGRKPGAWIKPGARVYVVAHGRLRGYALLDSVQRWDERSWSLVRVAGAVACTIEEPIPGFRGIRHAESMFSRESLIAFPDWQTADVA